MENILSKSGVKPDDTFKCVDCGDLIKGSYVLYGGYLYIVRVNKDDPRKSTFRCECCQDEVFDNE